MIASSRTRSSSSRAGLAALPSGQHHARFYEGWGTYPHRPRLRGCSPPVRGNLVRRTGWPSAPRSRASYPPRPVAEDVVLLLARQPAAQLLLRQRRARPAFRRNRSRRARRSAVAGPFSRRRRSSSDAPDGLGLRLAGEPRHFRWPGARRRDSSGSAPSYTPWYIMAGVWCTRRPLDRSRDRLDPRSARRRHQVAGQRHRRPGRPPRRRTPRRRWRSPRRAALRSTPEAAQRDAPRRRRCRPAHRQALLHDQRQQRRPAWRRPRRGSPARVRAAPPCTTSRRRCRPRPASPPAPPKSTLNHESSPEVRVAVVITSSNVRTAAIATSGDSSARRRGSAA